MVKMKYAGEVSHFLAELPPVEAGSYTLRVLASSPKSVNFAMYESKVEFK